MTSENTIQVLTIESDEETKRSLQHMLNPIRGLVLSGQAATAQEARQHLQHNNIDVALIDLNLSATDVIALTKQIRQEHPTVRLLIFTSSDRADDIFNAMNAGADGYILKENMPRVLEIAIRSVRLGAVWLDPGIAKQVLQIMETKAATPSRVLPTGLMILPLMPEEKSLLFEVASSNCVDGVCMLDPSFVAKLRRFSPKD